VVALVNWVMVQGCCAGCGLVPPGNFDSLVILENKTSEKARKLASLWYKNKEFRNSHSQKISLIE